MPTDRFQKITVWENTVRIELLKQFRVLVDEYFREINSELPNTEKVDEYRKDINLILGRILEIIQDSGVSCKFCIPSPSDPEVIIRLNYLEHIFQIKEYRVSHKGLIDAIDREECTLKMKKLLFIEHTTLSIG